MSAIIVAQRNDNNNVQASSNLSYGNVSIDQYGNMNVNIKNNQDPSIYTSQNDTYTAESSKCQLICGVRNDSSSTTLCDTNNNMTPLACNEKGVLFTYVNGVAGNVSITNGDISAMKNDIATIKSDISSMKTYLQNISDILTDVHISASNRLRVLAQAL